MNNRQPRQPEDVDLGPEPDWLLDDDVAAEAAEPVAQESEPATSVEPQPEPVEAEPDPEPKWLPEEKNSTQSSTEPTSPTQDEPTSELAPMPPPKRTETVPAEQSTVEAKRTHPWLWGAIPLILLIATGLVAWFGTTQTLNGVATWDAIRANNPPLLPARWAMTTWWLVLPLMGTFLIFGMLPRGRTITRIKVTGPLLSAALAATAVWIIAQHWNWDLLGIASMAIAVIATLASYLLVTLGPHITKIRQRIIAVIPLSAALGYSLMLTVLAWQSYSSQPFGERGSSVLFTLLLVMIAAVFAFFLRDGLFSLVLAIWFAGVVHQQWGDDAVISLVGAIAFLFTAALAVLGTILATESHRPSLTTSVDTRRGRISFFKKSEKSTGEELP